MTEKPLKMFFIAAVAATAANGVRADAWDDAMRRARELCAKMTLEEKAGKLMVYDYREFGAERWGAYTNLVNRNEIGALMRVQSASETRRLQGYKLAHSRLGIPLIIHEDITHGWVTTLPLQLAMACSWDDAAVEKAEAVAARERELREFTSVTLDPGETRRVVFALPRDAFAIYDADLKRVVEPGEFTVFVGGDSSTENGAVVKLP